MKLNFAKEVANLEQVTLGQLQQRYVEVFGEPVRCRHKRYLTRRIASRLQANAESRLSARALRRAEELANVADVRVTPPRTGTRRATATTSAAIEVAKGAALGPLPASKPIRLTGRRVLGPGFIGPAQRIGTTPGWRGDAAVACGVRAAGRSCVLGRGFCPIARQFA